MAEALLLSVIEKLDINYRNDETNEIGSVIEEMREIVDIVRDKKMEEGRSLNFLVCDLVDMAEDALDLYRKRETHQKYYDSIHGWIGEIKKRMLKLGDDGMEAESNMRSSENVDDKYVVGLEEDVQMLLRTKIIGVKGDLETVLIKGMCGTGKTTLAREIYNHATVIERFKHRAWVCVSTNSTLKELLIKLIQQVVPENLHTSSLLENMDNRSLRDMIRQHLQGKRHFIVLDNVPKQMHVRSFLKALPGSIDGSILLLTSHTRQINIHVDDQDVHHMKPLDSNKSWQLFLKTINHGNKLTGEHKFPMSLVQEGKQMLRKCDGLPLAIKEVGKQLAEKKVSRGSEWEQLLESVDFGPILKLLEPFYHKLDPKLESCFLCMAFFKENTTLRKEKLTQIWVAGGLVDLEDECKPYLNGLINDSFIDVKDKSTEYHMNVVLHMLSIQKAEEKLGFEILRNNRNNLPSQSPRQHRVIICSRDRFNYSTDQDKHLVSLFFHGGGYFDANWESFELLKILDWEDFGLKNLPESSIDTMMGLRYLGLRNNYIQKLPRSLGKLKELGVLDIALNFMVELPDIIWKMGSLRHLYMSDVICREPLKIDTLENLETLSYISFDNWMYEASGLDKMTRLYKLGIEEIDEYSDVSKLFASLAKLKKLDHLILRGYRFRSMPCLDDLGILRYLNTLKLDGLLASLPNYLPPYIQSLTLVNSCLDEDPMPQLGKLQMLYYLKLRNAYTGQQMVILHNGFPTLKVLCIEELWNLRNVRGKGKIRLLNKLQIHDCPHVDALSKVIESIIYIKELKMVTTKSIAKKIRNSAFISKIGIVNINP
ncbi:disease resistance RPP8-like protein 3 [Salvia miltiorrhiza]|uniref:disease resistance RPP8-like protein 3 n=1 Tax=Salvia miltiorrhiza TaxID=226208 RepID=UPI0025AD8B60|nr:disease resistance RPP8-like protein 3 [Salvia miltiorrhiza]XP_057802127.1 disease resistance RPP8-like protein 3 [Salvia miltiorrhiza]XP_057802128.1 disease resistance RPP8-like protein 3 [Salvia miltiorrhiza]XP_057802129.1 disease resistance RPP8-like protein 3 [Salvia miltiorrhiza]XP_057802130.1 disease resistance RPP8-like protein 3 [Salvia miltiorrhiza]